MKLLTVNIIELIQDRLKIENEIDNAIGELEKLEHQCREKASEIERMQFNLMQLQYKPNNYLRRKQHDERLEYCILKIWEWADKRESEILQRRKKEAQNG